MVKLIKEVETIMKRAHQSHIKLNLQFTVQFFEQRQLNIALVAIKHELRLFVTRVTKLELMVN